MSDSLVARRSFQGLHLALLFFDNSFEQVFHMEQLNEEVEHPWLKVLSL